jgi:hypothetical protein
MPHDWVMDMVMDITIGNINECHELGMLFHWHMEGICCCNM